MVMVPWVASPPSESPTGIPARAAPRSDPPPPRRGGCISGGSSRWERESGGRLARLQPVLGGGDAGGRPPRRLAIRTSRPNHGGSSRKIRLSIGRKPRCRRSWLAPPPSPGRGKGRRAGGRSGDRRGGSWLARITMDQSRATRCSSVAHRRAQPEAASASGSGDHAHAFPPLARERAIRGSLHRSIAHHLHHVRVEGLAHG